MRLRGAGDGFRSSPGNSMQNTFNVNTRVELIPIKRADDNRASKRVTLDLLMGFGCAENLEITRNRSVWRVLLDDK
jgi:hypothetical protein